MYLTQTNRYIEDLDFNYNEDDSAYTFAIYDINPKYGLDCILNVCTWDENHDSIILVDKKIKLT